MFTKKALVFMIISTIISLIYMDVYVFISGLSRGGVVVLGVFFAGVIIYLWKNKLFSEKGLIDKISDRWDVPLQSKEMKVNPLTEPMKKVKKKIFLITSNPGKVQSFSTILGKYDLGVDIEILNGEYVENKEEGTTQRVVLDGAKDCADEYKKSVIVQDSGLFIASLQGFPGVNTKFCINTIGLEGVLKLLEGVENRACEWIFSLGYCEPGKAPVEFSGTLKGTISHEIVGDMGFGFDPIFIPYGYEQTFGENTGLRDSLSPFNETIQQLAEYLKNHRY